MNSRAPLGYLMYTYEDNTGDLGPGLVVMPRAKEHDTIYWNYPMTGGGKTGLSC